jgi:8-oxo-dGTP pyrophosphatase MutT (NUDIX family)
VPMTHDHERLHIVDVAVRIGPPDDLKYLVVTNRKHPGKFTMPGGKVEPMEAPIDAAVRELKEETGLAVSQESLEYIGAFNFKWHGKDLRCFSFTIKDNTFGELAPRAVEAGTKVSWVSRDDLLDPAGNCLSPGFYGWLLGKKDW